MRELAHTRTGTLEMYIKLLTTDSTMKASIMKPILAT